MMAPTRRQLLFAALAFLSGYLAGTWSAGGAVPRLWPRETEAECQLRYLRSPMNRDQLYAIQGACHEKAGQE
jgi:hypothetical protein